MAYGKLPGKKLIKTKKGWKHESDRAYKNRLNKLLKNEFFNK
jgi:hypothetical protein